MAPRRGSDDTFTFDLVPDDEVDEPLPGTEDQEPAPGRAPDGDPGQDGGSRPWWVRVRGASRRRTVAAVVVLVALLGTAGTVSTVRDRERTERLRAAPGGVADLSVPLRERWTYGEGDPWPVAAMRDLVVVITGTGALALEQQSWFQPEPLTPQPQGGVLRGIDLDTGRERWQVPVERVENCGPRADGAFGVRPRMPVSEVVVCVVEVDGQRSVLTVDGQGRTTVRALEEAGPAGDVAVAAGGAVVRAETAGEMPPLLPDIVGDERIGWDVSEAFQPPDVRVVMEDARTGEVRWERLLPVPEVRPGGDWWACAQWSGGGDPVLDVGRVSLGGGDPVVVTACGLTAQLTSSGEVVAGSGLDESGRRYETWAHALADGGFAVVDMSRSGDLTRGPARVLDRDGREVASPDGGVLDPLSTDGTQADLVLTRDGGEVVALDASGREVWRAEGLSGVRGAVARAGGTAVLLRDDSGRFLVGLDLGTGRTLWTWPMDVGTGASPGYVPGVDEYVRGAWTDGRVLLVAGPGYGATERPASWTALDLRSGDVMWQVPQDEAGPSLPGTGVYRAVDGRVLFWDGTRVTRLG
ncbi:hypothetical protein DNL40_08720 [Xylanimonas oleitrophica]|uniref:PQQ-binding-like beta-propeller repeat protein n=1 Tax=Xylanimonas oleitrophica TaxID=2607479 RepID=A0A2W5YF21_9MICO|nr:hypothetical protein [Xylanimonas oleitrophica]PZR53081.1 hypothetical protein DNL40_08720 [Xylanimonas oleitrophica]